ncbi:MAG: spherulation-specific family 4 protein [Burkholderiaceae bacterium]
MMIVPRPGARATRRPAGLLAWGITAALALALILLATETVQAASVSMRLLVPAYFYPKGNQFWRKLNEAAAQVPLTAILNPDSGPGRTADPNYVAAVTALRAAGGRVIGYVPTGYGRRDLDEVIGEVNRYLAMYEVDGFFIDEMAYDDAPASYTYYRNLYQAIKDLGAHYQVIGNPGTSTQAGYLEPRTADVIVTFEDARRAYRRFVPADWTAGWPGSNFGHLVIGAGGANAMREAVNRAAQFGVGHVFVTRDRLPNPWDTLPGYWQAQLDCVGAINAGQAC